MKRKAYLWDIVKEIYICEDCAYPLSIFSQAGTRDSIMDFKVRPRQLSTVYNNHTTTINYWGLIHVPSHVHAPFQMA